MKKCPKCGGTEFIVSAHVAQDWLVDENGNFLEVTEDCTDVVHQPDDGDVWQCDSCGYAASGDEFNV